MAVALASVAFATAAPVPQAWAQSHRSGMGATLYDRGTTFRVWAPHATSVSVAGGFNGWSPTANPLAAEPGGLWSADVRGAAPGQRYRYVIRSAAGEETRRDPYSRLVTSSDYDEGLSVIYDPNAFDWGDDDSFTPPALDDLVIYEMHVGTFNDARPERCGGFADAIARLDRVADLGVTAVEVLPVAEFFGNYSSGYDPADIFAVENRAYGGPDGFKAFVKECHARNLAVILDVVYNHWGPWDVTTHRFDGWWTDAFPGGIYFYDAARIDSPWGPRPNYAVPRVRRYLFDNLRMWIDEYRVDGFRWDATSNIWNTDTGFGQDLPEGWSLLQQANAGMERLRPGVINIAEDIFGGDRITRPVRAGGAGFDAQWHFLAAHLRAELTKATDAARNMGSIRYALTANYNGDPWQRVIFSESHNEICCGHDRLTVEIDSAAPDGWKARKLSTLGAALTFTAPGIPMIYQGQEFLDHQPFDDRKPIDWGQLDRHPGVRELYRDLIRLRRNLGGTTVGLKGANLNVHHVNDAAKVIAYHRWDVGGPGDDAIVAANFSAATLEGYVIGLPRAGTWHVRFNSDSLAYGPDYSGVGEGSVEAHATPRDGMPFSSRLTLAPYSAVVLSQD